MRILFALLFAAMLSLSFAVSGISADKKTPVTKTAEASNAASAEMKAERAAAKQELLDINTASESDMKALAGIGDAYSKTIITGCPYANKVQLLSKRIVPQVT